MEPVCNPLYHFFSQLFQPAFKMVKHLDILDRVQLDSWQICTILFFPLLSRHSYLFRESEHAFAQTEAGE